MTMTWPIDNLVRIRCLSCRGLGTMDDGRSSTLRECDLCNGEKYIRADKLEELVRQARAKEPKPSKSEPVMRKLGLYKISQVRYDYETYESAVVVAESVDDAKLTWPGGRDESGYPRWDGSKWLFDSDGRAGGPYPQWTNPEDVLAVLLAELPEDSKYKRGDEVCAMYHHG